MTPIESGRYCAACNKAVVDFTQASDWETADYLRKNPDTCGRFTHDQLQKIYEVPVYKKNKVIGHFKYAICLALGLTKLAEARANFPISEKTEHYSNPKILKPQEKVLIKGRIVADSLHLPSTLQVICGNYTEKIKPDSLGNFNFFYPVSNSVSYNVLTFKIAHTNISKPVQVFLKMPDKSESGELNVDWGIELSHLHGSNWKAEWVKMIPAPVAIDAVKTPVFTSVTGYTNCEPFEISGFQSILNIPNDETWSETRLKSTKKQTQRRMNFNRKSNLFIGLILILTLGIGLLFLKKYRSNN